MLGAGFNVPPTILFPTTKPAVKVVLDYLGQKQGDDYEKAEQHFRMVLSAKYRLAAPRSQ